MTGVAQCGFAWTGPPNESQQSWPAVQQAAPQQKSLDEHVPPEHGASSQAPVWQYGWDPVQTLPQAPQLSTSLSVSTHAPSQQSWSVAHVWEQAGPPLVDELELLAEPELLLLDALVLEVFVLEVVLPPLPSLWTPPPQAESARKGKHARISVARFIMPDL
jgi:hypothetical protein